VTVIAKFLTSANFSSVLFSVISLLKSKGINIGDEVFDVCCENKTFWLDVR